VPTRQRLLSILSLYLAAVMALPWPIAFAANPSPSRAAAIQRRALPEAGVNRCVMTAASHEHAPVDSTTISALGAFDDEADDDCLLGIGLAACWSLGGPHTSVSTPNPVCAMGVPTPRAPACRPLRC
jgi:hypothetical protein